VNIEIIQHGLLGICFLMLGMSLLFPYLGLLGYIIIYFLRVGEVYPALGSIRFELLAGVYVLIRMFIAGTPSAARLWSNPTTKALAASIMVVFLSVPFAVSPDVSWEWAIYYLKRFIFAFMVLAAVDTREKLKGFFWTFSLMTCWVALEPFLGYLSGQAFVAQDVFRIRGSTGYFDNPNALANTTSQALPLLWGLLLSTRRKITKAFLFALGVFCLVLIVMTGSRGGGVGSCRAGRCLGLAKQESGTRGRFGLLRISFHSRYYGTAVQGKTRNHLAAWPIGRLGPLSNYGTPTRLLDAREAPDTWGGNRMLSRGAEPMVRLGTLGSQSLWTANGRARPYRNRGLDMAHHIDFPKSFKCKNPVLGGGRPKPARYACLCKRCSGALHHATRRGNDGAQPLWRGVVCVRRRRRAACLNHTGRAGAGRRHVL